MKPQRVGRNRLIAPIHAHRFGRRNKAIALYALPSYRCDTRCLECPSVQRFWKSASGRELVREWFNELSREDQRTIGRDIAKVQFGWPMGLPACGPLGGGLWEVRSTLRGRREARVLFGFYGGMLITLHAFIKKTQKTAPDDLALSRQRLKEISS